MSDPEKAVERPEGTVEDNGGHVVESGAAACERALYGDGVAVVEHLGVSEEVRKQVLRSVLETTGKPGLGEGNGPVYYSDFDPDVAKPILDAALSELGDAVDEDMAAGNLQVNHYSPGAYKDRHVDIDEVPIKDLEDLESLSFIYVLKGSKDLVVWPQAADKPQSGPVSIRQQPDMLIVLRGAAIQKDEILHQSIYHSVPDVETESAILTFDLFRIRPRPDES